jgi:GT2 family glycosyltransferase/glycosyltransferase involved in cell wall biosynthesis
LIHSLFQRVSRKRRIIPAPPHDLPSVDEAMNALPFALAQPPDPQISIIIPAHNEPGQTVRCLLGLSRHQTRFPFEVIVVDDGSDEVSRAIVGRVAGTQIVRHDTRKGFVAACNAGAAQARGAFLLFVNNDTYVQPAWLDELAGTFSLFADAGAVGAALIFPDGRLQEAGSIVWNDGGALNIGRGQDPDDPDFCFARTVDYCSAACLMIRADMFRRLGGFDQRYEPAYYEDTDLCMRVREAGYSVYVQPLARIIHVEGATAGTDPRRGEKRFQAINQLKFHERWKERLGSAPRPTPFGTTQFRLPGQRRILIADHALPTPDQDAGSLILMEIVATLQRLGYLVSIAAQRHPHGRDEHVQRLERAGIGVVRAPHYRSVLEYISVHDGQIDLLLMVRHGVAEQILPHLAQLAVQPRTLLLSPELHFLRSQREAALNGDSNLDNWAIRERRWELAVIRQVDATITHSDVEMELLRAELPEKPIHLLPWIVPVHLVVPNFEVRRNLLFVGGFAHRPNVDAIVHFVHHVWPNLSRLLPGVTLRIVGSHLPPDVQRLAGGGIEAVGYVGDLRQELDRARICIAPLRWGAGFKGKVAAALAAGLPGVISPIAAEGMGLTDGKHCLVAELGPSFADSVERLYNSSELWHELSRNGLDLAAQRWSRDLADRTLATILQETRVAPSVVLSDMIETHARQAIG